MYYQLFQNNTIPKTFSNETLEGNWYEDRCVSKYDEDKKREFKLRNPNAWQYDTTYSEIGLPNKNKQHLNKFSQSNDNYINFQNKDYNMYVTTYKHSLDDKYKETFRPEKRSSDYFKKNPNELDAYRQNWTKREQNFETTYKSDILKRTGKMMTK
jgi:hypothetical protein